MKDCVGNEIAIGDFVSFIRPAYHDMKIGRVVRFSPKNVKVEALISEKDITGEIIIRDADKGFAMTIRPENLTVINETASKWTYIPRPGIIW